MRNGTHGEGGPFGTQLGKRDLYMMICVHPFSTLKASARCRTGGLLASDNVGSPNRDLYSVRQELKNCGTNIENVIYYGANSPLFRDQHKSVAHGIIAASGQHSNNNN